MKNFLPLIFLAFAVTLPAQDDYMDKIARESCECLEKVSPDVDGDRFNVELGLCMIQACEPYQKQLKKDYDIDFERIDVEGERLGRIIGLRMASICPTALLAASERSNGSSEPENASMTFEGKITKVDKEFFIVFSAKDDMGKLQKFYWLTFVESKLDLIGNHETLVGEQVKITYMSQEFFDPKIEEYRPFFIIQKMERINR